MSTKTISFAPDIVDDYCDYKAQVVEKVDEQRLFANLYVAGKLTLGNGAINEYWKGREKALHEQVKALSGDGMERYSRYAQARYTAEVQYRSALKTLNTMRSDDSLVARISVWLENKFNRLFGKEAIL